MNAYIPFQSQKISPHAYHSNEHYTHELKKFFPNTWLFAGLLFELKGKSHYGVRLGEIEVLLQCDEKGIPHAFLNVCTHRHAKLCEPGLHNGPIRCPYHSWVFDRQGIPSGIPQKKLFPAVIACPENFRLAELSCETVGQFIFVRTSHEGLSLKEYLGTQYQFLKKSSSGFDNILDEFQEEVPSNWKIAIENSLEGYHVASVHQRTLSQVDGMSHEEKNQIFFMNDPLHSHLEHATDIAWLARFARIEKKIGKWPWRFENYTHHYIFPNLTVTSFMGYSFHVQRFDPIATNLTKVHSRTLGVKLIESSYIGEKIIQKIYADGHAFTRKVFSEDSEICRKVQAGVEQAIRPVIFAENLEDRVAHFHQAYCNFIEKNNP